MRCKHGNVQVPRIKYQVSTSIFAELLCMACVVSCVSSTCCMNMLDRSAYVRPQPDVNLHLSYGTQMICELVAYVLLNSDVVLVDLPPCVNVVSLVIY